MSLCKAILVVNSDLGEAHQQLQRCMRASAGGGSGGGSQSHLQKKTDGGSTMGLELEDPTGMVTESQRSLLQAAALMWAVGSMLAVVYIANISN